MKILSITEFYPIHPRLIKISETFGKNEMEYLSFKNEIKNNTKILRELLYFILTLKKIKKYKPDIVICRGLKPSFFCVIINWFVNFRLFHDVPDLIPIEFKLKCKAEQFCIKRAEKIFLASRFFCKYYEKYSNKIVVLENYPSKEKYKLDFETKFDYNSKNKILSFIGIIRYPELLKKLIDSVKGKKIDLLFFGNGANKKNIENYCKDNNIGNVHFFGEYNYLDLYKFYNISDFVWAAYDYRENNVKYAISNKFYENILYEKVGIYSKFTDLGDYIEKNKIGLTIDFLNKEEMETLIDNLINNDFEHIRKNIREYKKENILFWEEQQEEIKKIGEIYYEDNFS